LNPLLERVGVHLDSWLGRGAGALDHAVEGLSTTVPRRAFETKTNPATSSFPSSF
jgi:hypothetical protein